MKVNEDKNYKSIGDVIVRSNDRSETRAYIPEATFCKGKGNNEKNLTINLYGNVSGYFPRYVAVQRVKHRLYIFPNVHGYAMAINKPKKITDRNGREIKEHATLNIPYSKDEGLHEWDGLVFDKSDSYYGVIHYDSSMYKYYIDMDDAAGHLGYMEGLTSIPYSEDTVPDITPEGWNRIIDAIMKEVK